MHMFLIRFFFASRRRHTRWPRDWSSDVCSSDLFLDGGFFYVLPRHGFVPPVTATATDGCFLGGWDLLFEGLPSGLLLGGVTATTATATSTVTFFVLARVGVSRVLRTEGRCEGVGGLIEYRRSLFRESTTVTGAGLVLTSPATAPTP